MFVLFTAAICLTVGMLHLAADNTAFIVSGVFLVGTNEIGYAVFIVGVTHTADDVIAFITVGVVCLDGTLARGLKGQFIIISGVIYVNYC